MLIVITFLLVALLPFLPAIRELRRPSDCAPLTVYQGNQADASEPFLAEERPDSCLYLPGERVLSQAPESVTHIRGEQLIVQCATAAQLSASQNMRLLPGVTFQVAQAPVLEFGPLRGTPCSRARQENKALTERDVQHAQWQPLQQWWYAPGAARIRAGSSVKGDVLAKSLTVEDGARVHGSLKVDGDLVIGANCEIFGSCIARSITLGQGSKVRGCVVADQNVALYQNVTVGSPKTPASVLAMEVTVNAGVTVYGGVTAHRRAQVLLAQNS